MPRNESEPQGVIAAVQRLLEDTSIADGARLPPERELAQTIGVSRRQLRSALDTLAEQGVVFRHRGQGTFAAPPPLPDAGRHRVLASSVTPDQIMDVRLQIEPHIAQLAARRATPEAVQQLRALMDNISAAETHDALELADEIFHYRIAELAGNPLYMEIYKLIKELRKSSGWRGRRPETDVPQLIKASASQHEAIFAAIAAGDGAAANRAVHDHLTYVSNAITDSVAAR